MWGNPLYHQYVCVNQGGVVTCGGQDTSKPPYGPGKPSHDDPSKPRNRCEKVAPDNNCLEKCLLDAFNGPRPQYSLINVGGSNCQQWSNDILSACQAQCSKKADGNSFTID